jgi:transglutaminase/protease-like cytokinesis protein 3
MHSSKDIPHPLAVALPMIHTGENPPYEFLLRHPTPHAQRHDLYVMQPQCARLAINNTFVFAVRQHPAAPFSKSSSGEINTVGRTSPVPIMRPSSALSMVSSSYRGSNASTTSIDAFTAATSVVSSSKSGSSREKPAKLAIQSPSGKILRLMRKADHMISTSSNVESATEGNPEGSVWETVIKIGERGVWRGLVLADRSARWCVFCEWECF